MSRRSPRPLAGAVQAVRDSVAPATLLAQAQLAWPRVAGPAAAQQSAPVREREGTLTVACRSATWANELDLLGETLLEKLACEVGHKRILRLRFTADAHAHPEAFGPAADGTI